ICALFLALVGSAIGYVAWASHQAYLERVAEEKKYQEEMADIDSALRRAEVRVVAAAEKVIAAGEEALSTADEMKNYKPDPQPKFDRSTASGEFEYQQWTRRQAARINVALADLDVKAAKAMVSFTKKQEELAAFEVEVARLKARKNELIAANERHKKK